MPRETHTQKHRGMEERVSKRDRQTDRTWFLTCRILSTVFMKPNLILVL